MGDNNFSTDTLFTLPRNIDIFDIKDAAYNEYFINFNQAIVNRYYYEQEPCEFIVNSYNVKTITLLESSERLIDDFFGIINFKIKYTDDSIEVGRIYLCYKSTAITNTASDQYRQMVYPEWWTNRLISLDHMIFFKTQQSTTNCMSIISCLYRDLNILDIETKHYNKQSDKIKTSSLEYKKSNKRYWNKIVWVPRKKIIYDQKRLSNKSKIKRLVSEYIPINVMGHLRKCENPSEKQKQVAKEFGFIIPSGFTFVRPYSKLVDKSYYTKFRSKSALSILYGE